MKKILLVLLAGILTWNSAIASLNSKLTLKQDLDASSRSYLDMKKKRMRMRNEISLRPLTKS
jgi:hypothetical protein